MALALVDRALEQARSTDGAVVHLPLLHRVRGFALIGQRDLAAATDALAKSLAEARARRADYEIALTLRPLARLADSKGGSGHELLAESAAILERLGVVQVFEPALESERLSAPRRSRSKVAVR